MSQLMNIARGVTAALNDLNAELIVLPELTLRKNSAQRVIVSPAGSVAEPITRGRRAEQPVVHVYVVRHCLENETDTAADTLCAIAARFPGRSYAGALCVAAGFDPVLDAGYLREENLFLGCVTLKFIKIN